jgi:hypothetical protein
MFAAPPLDSRAYLPLDLFVACFRHHRLIIASSSPHHRFTLASTIAHHPLTLDRSLHSPLM